MSERQPLDGLPRRQGSAATALGLVAALEAVTLAILLINLGVDGSRSLAQVVGPVHGLVYLSGIALTWSATSDRRARWLSVVPVIGSIFAYRLVRRQ